MHYNGNKIRPSFVKSNDLLAGSLSVWRMQKNTEAELSEIKSVLTSSGPAGASLYDLFTATAGRVRDIRVTDQPTQPALHVYDDCRTDDNGGKHPLHAVVAICNAFDPANLEKDSPTFLEIRDGLVSLLKENIAWALPSAERV